MIASSARVHKTARVHPTADLEADVAIGANTSVWHRAQLRTGARIGDDCIIGRDAFIDEGVTLGDRVKVQNGALVYHGVTVENGVFIGPGAILTNDRFPRAVTTTGDLARDDDWEVVPIVLHEGCSIGAGAVVIAGVDVGRFATVGAGAVVTRYVNEHALVVGNPARRIGWMCSCGQRLVDSNGDPAPADPDRYAADHNLSCQGCGRRYVYVRDAETVAERGGPGGGPVTETAAARPNPKQGAPA